jgi:ATP-dependent RNA circularization protein (DNA/RNA ligase family)
MLKELEKKLRDQHATWTEDRLWDAFAVTAPDQVKGRTISAPTLVLNSDSRDTVSGFPNATRKLVFPSVQLIRSPW